MQGIELRIARIRAGLKQYELAQRAGIRPNELSLFETGRARPNADKASRLARALQLYVGDRRPVQPAEATP